MSFNQPLRGRCDGTKAVPTTLGHVVGCGFRAEPVAIRGDKILSVTTKRAAYVVGFILVLPAIIFTSTRLTLFQAGFTYRARRIHRLMDAGQCDKADRLKAWLRKDADRFRRRVEAGM